MPVRYDYLNMMRPRVGAEGVAPEELQAIAGRLVDARNALAARRKDRSLGFFDVPGARPSRDTMRTLLDRLDREIDTLVVLGIGGSNLGAQAVIQALQGLKKTRVRPLRVLWGGDATDPLAVTDLLAQVDWKKTAINVISKSGDTIEPMSVFILLRDRLLRAVGAKKLQTRVIATTDPKKGTLRRIAEEDGLPTLPVPENVGGRFSVFTEVGAFPILAAGVDLDALWKGAAAENDRFWKAKPLEHPALAFAALQALMYMKGKPISVLMPYAARLGLVGAWYRQLWAESLGKKSDRKGRTVNIGPTPVSAVGPADQHSQIQLYNEGPNDKSVTFVEIDRFDEDERLPEPFSEIEGVSYFAGCTFKEIVHAERQATAEALVQNRRPNGTLHIEKLNAEEVGSLLQMFMNATAVAGELFDVNAFDQPGVEAGKREMYKLLGRKGY